MTASTSTATPVAADVAAKAQKELAALVKTARTAYSKAAAAEKVTRDSAIAKAYAAFSADPTVENQKVLTTAQKTARQAYSKAVAAAKVARDSKVAAAYAQFATVTTPAA